MSHRASRHMAVRVALKRSFRKKFRNDPSALSAIDVVLNDDDLCDMVAADLEDQYLEQENIPFTSGEGESLLVGGALTNFLQWLIDNADQIIAFIKMIVSLFI